MNERTDTMKKIFSILLCLCLAVCFFGCGKKDDGDITGSSGDKSNMTAEGKEEIYFLNFKPEVAKVYDKIVETYKEETGVTVKVVTAASDTYEQTLTSEVAKKDAPTIFQINGPIGYENWKNFCADLSDTKLYSYLTDKSLAIKDGGGVYGIPYVVEAYGIIYNKAITDKYFKLETRQKKVNSMDEIVNFETFKTVVEDMTKHKKELEIDGVFASTSFSSGNQWRWHTHLANVPMYYEFSENEEYDDPTVAGLNTSEASFKYAENYKNVFDLYINNSGTDKGLLGGKSVNDSMSEFALGKVAMVQNGTWAYNDIKELKGNVVQADEIKMLPIYTGAKGEENQGLCVGTENYICVNSKVSKEKQEASIAFLEWLFSSEKGKKYVTDELEFISPFNTFGESETPENPLSKETVRWMNKDGIKTVPWIFTSFPSEVFKEDFGSALLEYTQGTKDWEHVKNTFVTSWKNESK